ncbi:RagB/SusD family nutrient uptake outer membrane protein [Puteibacter caeruleilacunae]|nr:RagB/SusD family nutrient uptake outer membrane protein [Puteibacter caeruleilacunae]
MKLYKIFKGAAIGLMVMTMGCTDLEVEVESQFTTDNFPTTEADYEALIGPIYTTFSSTMGRTYWHLQALTTDECLLVAKNGGWYDGGRYAQMHFHTWNDDHSYIRSLYKDGFASISTTNRVLSMLEDAPDTPTKEQSIAEVRVMRAFYMFLMTDNYGAIPIVEKFGEEKEYDRTSRADVCKFLEKELNECIPFLKKDVNADTYSRPTYYMANALLAKLYINWEVYAGEARYDKVVETCDKIIEDGKFELDSDYLAMFNYDNGPQIKDFIYAMPFDGARIRGMYHARFWLHKLQREQFELPYGPSGPQRALPSIIDKFNLEGDIRNDIWLKGPQFNPDGSPIMITTTKKGLDQYYSGPDENDEVQWQLSFSKDIVFKDVELFDVGDDQLSRASGYRCNKFYPDKTSSDRHQGNDVPVFRYADILLMKAEAILRGASATLNDTPVSLMNQIRERANAPEVTSVTLDELLDERAREFYSENWRRNDLIRFGKFGDPWGWKEASDENHIIFPIPYTEMDLNPHWTQNPGY